MKKVLAVILALAMVFVLASCGNNEEEQGGKRMGKKIVMLRNMGNSDHTSMFFEGATREAKRLGYEIDTFISDGNDGKMQNLMEQALQQDYDIWVVTTANDGYQEPLVQQAVDKGITVICDGCSGNQVEGTVWTGQSEPALAEMAVDAMVQAYADRGFTDKLKVVELNSLGVLMPFDVRHDTLTAYNDAGKIDYVALAPLTFGGDTYSQVYNIVVSYMEQIEGTFGLFLCSSGIAPGALDAIRDYGRQNDVIISGVDISNDMIEQMVQNQPQFYGTACVDSTTLGIVCVRLGVLLQNGQEVPADWHMPANYVYGKDLTADDSMDTLRYKFENFYDTELWNTDFLKSLKG